MGTILLDFSGKIAYIRITFKMRRGVARKERLEEKMMGDRLAESVRRGALESDWIAAGCDSPEEFEEALKCPFVQRPDQLWSPDEIAECFTGVNTPLDTEPGGLYEALWVVAIAIEKGTVDPGNWFKELSDSDQKKTKIVGVIRKKETDQLFADMEARRGTDKGE